MYTAAADAGLLKSKKHRPRGYEVTEDTQILASIFKLMQQLIAVTARDRSYKPKDWPTPVTAAERARQVEADRVHFELEAEIVRVDLDEFEKHIAEHAGVAPIVRVEREDATEFIEPDRARSVP